MDNLPSPTPPRRSLVILDSGSCEPFKAIVHATALGLFALMASYNGAAWLRRRQKHLAINAVLYFTGVLWEQRHVAHHLASCAKPCHDAPAEDIKPPLAA